MLGFVLSHSTEGGLTFIKLYIFNIHNLMGFGINICNCEPNATIYAINMSITLGFILCLIRMGLFLLFYVLIKSDVLISTEFSEFSSELPRLGWSPSDTSTVWPFVFPFRYELNSTYSLLDVADNHHEYVRPSSQGKNSGVFPLQYVPSVTLVKF